MSNSGGQVIYNQKGNRNTVRSLPSEKYKVGAIQEKKPTLLKKTKKLLQKNTKTSPFKRIPHHQQMRD